MLDEDNDNKINYESMEKGKFDILSFIFNDNYVHNPFKGLCFPYPVSYHFYLLSLLYSLSPHAQNFLAT